MKQKKILNGVLAVCGFAFLAVSLTTGCGGGGGGGGGENLPADRDSAPDYTPDPNPHDPPTTTP